MVSGFEDSSELGGHFVVDIALVYNWKHID